MRFSGASLGSPFWVPRRLNRVMLRVPRPKAGCSTSARTVQYTIPAGTSVCGLPQQIHQKRTFALSIERGEAEYSRSGSRGKRGDVAERRKERARPESDNLGVTNRSLLHMKALSHLIYLAGTARNVEGSWLKNRVWS